MQHAFSSFGPKDEVNSKHHVTSAGATLPRAVCDKSLD